MDTDPINLLPTIQVISAESIFTMCGKCGNRCGANKVAAVLKTTLKFNQPKLN